MRIKLNIYKNMAALSLITMRIKSNIHFEITMRKKQNTRFKATMRIQPNTSY